MYLRLFLPKFNCIWATYRYATLGNNTSCNVFYIQKITTICAMYKINVGKLTYALNMHMDKRNQNIKNRIEKRRGANLVPFTTIRKQLRSEYIEEK